MRDIKFRAWLPDIQMMNNWESGVDGGTKENIESYLDDPDSILMQYTGLRDKNGKEIYEGDIIRRVSPITGKVDAQVEVYFDKTHSAFMVKGFGVEGYNRQLGILLKGFADEPKYEVIGNIYENPELLTTTKTDKQ